MILFNINHSSLFFPYLIIISILSSVNSRKFQTQTSFSSKLKSTDYHRLAKYCYINDYGAWLERQQELMVWLNLAKLLKLPIQDSELIQKEMEQFRLQHECLRVIERLPVSIGPG